MEKAVVGEGRSGVKIEEGGEEKARNTVTVWGSGERISDQQGEMSNIYQAVAPVKEALMSLWGRSRCPSASERSL